MRKMLLTVLVFLLVASISNAFANDAEKEVRKVVTEAYFNGAFNKLDTETMQKGFHPDFAIFSAKGNEISRYPIATWIEGIEKWKKASDFDAEKAKMDCKIANLEVTGGCAMVKVEASKDGTLIYTDYLSLLKFEDGWKIVAKVYHKHS